MRVQLDGWGRRVNEHTLFDAPISAATFGTDIFPLPDDAVRAQRVGPNIRMKRQNSDVISTTAGVKIAAKVPGPLNAQGDFLIELDIGTDELLMLCYEAVKDLPAEKFWSKMAKVHAAMLSDDG